MLAQLVNDEIYSMPCRQRHCRLGERGAIKTGFAVDMFGGDQITAQGAVTPCVYGHVGAVRQLADDAGISCGEVQRHVACHAGDAQHLDLFWAGQCQQDCHGIVLARICINDNLARRHRGIPQQNVWRTLARPCVLVQRSSVLAQGGADWICR